MSVVPFRLRYLNTDLKILLKKIHVQLADLTVSKRPGTGNRIEIHFAIFNHLYLCFSGMKLAETL